MLCVGGGRDRNGRDRLLFGKLEKAENPSQSAKRRQKRSRSVGGGRGQGGGGEGQRGGEVLSLFLLLITSRQEVRDSLLPQCPKVGALHLGPINQVFSFL